MPSPTFTLLQILDKDNTKCEKIFDAFTVKASPEYPLLTLLTPLVLQDSQYVKAGLEPTRNIPRRSRARL